MCSFWSELGLSGLTLVGAVLVLGLSSAPCSAKMSPEVELNQKWAKAAFSEAKGAALPFSFVYGGKSSPEVTKSWKREVSDEKTSATVSRRTLTLTDPETGLQVRAVASIYTDTPGVDWTIYFTNNGASDTPIIEQARAVDVTIASPGEPSPVLHGIHGCYPSDWLPFDKPIANGERLAFGTTDGCPSTNDSPFFNVGFKGGGVITAVGWTGQWTGSVERVKDGGGLRIEAGMEFMHLKLHPGETIRTPRILMLHYTGEEADSYNLFRHTMFSHIMPRTNGKLVVPPIAHLSTSFDELNYTDESSVLSHLDAVKGLGFEYFWLDAYWHKNGFPAGVGNYGVPTEKFTPDPVRFPRGLKPVADAVKKDGFKFLLWFEPERVVAGTYIATEHPNFVISPSGDGSGLLDMGMPEARQYMTDALNAAIREYHLGCIRFDYNIAPLSYWQSVNAKDPDRVGMCEIRYTEGLYRMWDDLLKTNPGLFIDNCAGGGRRIDLETCSRSIALWRTDATIWPLLAFDFDKSALINQVMTGGLNRYVPYSTSGQMGAVPYQFRSGVNGGGISFCEDVRPPEVDREAAKKGRAEYKASVSTMYGDKGYPREELKKAIAEAKRVRKYYYGDFYALSPVTASPSDWCIYQYNLPEKNEGMIVAFRRQDAEKSTYECQVRGIDAKAVYDVYVSHTYKRSAAAKMTGAELAHLTIEIPGKPGSVIVEYKKQGWK